METYLFYTTHLIMIACVAVIITTGWSENIHAAVKKALDLANRISLSKKFGAIRYSFTKERICFKALLVNLLSIGLRISTQLLK